MGKLKIDKQRCKGCMLCIEACPQKILRISGDVNSRGTRYVLLADASKCTGCGMCVIMCPDCALEVAGDE